MNFDHPRPLEEMLRWSIERLEHGIVQMSNPRYFGLFNPGANFPAQCADRIAGAFNPQLASSASSPVPVALENHLIRAVARRAGMAAHATGHFATGGSEANCTSLLCALTAAHPAFASEGVRAFPGAPRFYTSRDCHIAWLKIAHQTGVGRGALQAHRHGRRRTDGSRGTRARHRLGSGGGRGSGDGRRHRRHHRRRHDRSAACLRRHRVAGEALVSRRCRVGRIRAGVRSVARPAVGHRAGRLGHHRCAQVAGDHHGLRLVHHRARCAACPRPSTPPRVSCPRAWRASTLI